MDTPSRYWLTILSSRNQLLKAIPFADSLSGCQRPQFFPSR
ncbi:YsgD/CorL family protein [Escherichia coli]